jgi:hypothetical protein
MGRFHANGNGPKFGQMLAPVAQRTDGTFLCWSRPSKERRFAKPEVVGSIPTGGSIFFKACA